MKQWIFAQVVEAFPDRRSYVIATASGRTRWRGRRFLRSIGKRTRLDTDDDRTKSNVGNERKMRGGNGGNDGGGSSVAATRSSKQASTQGDIRSPREEKGTQTAHASACAKKTQRRQQRSRSCD
jgi:hypothetical protein